MKNFYLDFPHKISEIMFRGKKYILKNTTSVQIDNKEFKVQKMLVNTGYVPKCRKNYNGDFIEEFIEGKQLGRKKLTDDLIKNIAVALKTIHSVPISKSIEKLLIENNTYSPKEIWGSLISNRTKIISSLPEVDRIKSFVDLMDRKISNYNYIFSIIHGDLSSANILVMKKNKIKIIDWTDARIDLPSLDIIQFFYLNKLNKKQQDLFFNYYKPDWLDQDLIRLHLLYLLVYDFICFSNNNSENKIRETKVLIKKILNNAK